MRAHANRLQHDAARRGLQSRRTNRENDDRQAKLSEILARAMRAHPASSPGRGKRARWVGAAARRGEAKWSWKLCEGHTGKQTGGQTCTAGHAVRTHKRFGSASIGLCGLPVGVSLSSPPRRAPGRHDILARVPHWPSGRRPLAANEREKANRKLPPAARSLLLART